MSVDVKISITVNSGNLSASIVLGPSDKAVTPEEETLKKMVWPYNYSDDGALLPGYSSDHELTLTTI